MITLEQAKSLRVGDILHSEEFTNADGTCERWKVNGRPKVWVTRPFDVRVPIKHGLRDFDYLTHNDLHCVHRAEDCTV